MNSSKLLSELPENLSTQPLQKFNYENLDTEIRMVVQQRTSEIKNLMRRTNQDIIEIGQKLTDVKAQLKHGNFRNWLKAEFDWSVKTASRFMQVAEKFKCDNLTHLDIATSALYLLASPSTLEEARAEALRRVSQGENITYTKAKTIVSKFKDKHLVPTVERNREQLEDTTPTPTSIVNQTANAEKIPDPIITEIEIIIKQLTSEQLTYVIINYANHRLSKCHLEAIITAVQQALDHLN